jgi:hypothetical protein
MCLVRRCNKVLNVLRNYPAEHDGKLYIEAIEAKAGSSKAIQPWRLLSMYSRLLPKPLPTTKHWN